MKKQFWIFLVFAIISISCQKEDDFFTDFDDTDTLVDDFDNDDDIWDDDNGQDDSADGEEGSLTLYSVSGDNLSKIKDYNVSQNLLPFQQDYAKHLQMWDFTTRLIPIEERDKIGEFEVFHGGGELLGYVAPINDNDLSKWRFALAIDAAENLEQIDFKDLFTYVTIHEFGHVVTLNDEQINVGGGSCNTYFTGEGCSKPNSYINKLYELGWEDIANEMDENGDNSHLYDKYKDRFVSDYAATNPGEDIAEVFSFFITKEDKPTGNSIADQKIKLLYDYPELVELRDKLRLNAPVRALRAGSWMTSPLKDRFKIRCSATCKKRHG